MRKFLLVVSLIGASFAGGAVVNGPALDWARQWIARQAQAGALGQNVQTASALGVEVFPSAPVPSITSPETGESLVIPEVAETEAGKAAARSDRALEEPSGTEPAADAVDPAMIQAKLESSAPSQSPAATATVTAPSAAAGAITKPAIAPSEPPSLSPPAEVRAPPIPVRPEGSTDSTAREGAGAVVPANPVPWGDAPDSTAPASAVLPEKEKPGTLRLPERAPAEQAPGKVPSASTSTTTASSGPVDAPAQPSAGRADGSPEVRAAIPDSIAWEKLRTQLKEAGVTQFWVEGNPSGSVRFRCVMPVAGQNAISQQFEAEGDDLFSAAQTMIKRILLWKATAP